MARTCEITGKGAIRGNKVSHSNHKTKRVFSPNLQTKKFFIPEENKEITLRVTAEGIRHINKNGISASLKKARAKGYTTK
ncbi:MAG: 50S ribosomal protein L28 [Bacteroidota bacterium]